MKSIVITILALFMLSSCGTFAPDCPVAGTAVAQSKTQKQGHKWAKKQARKRNNFRGY